MAVLVAAGGDTVKLFDLSLGSENACTLSYTPSPGFAVNSVSWNHTNLVVASAGEDKKISLCRSNGQNMGSILGDSMSAGGVIEESILSINFSNKGSRYICSGGSANIIRIWDLQKRRCVKWMKGHNSAITGVMCNCKDEHLASISLNGDLIVHNLASGAKMAELKDPNQQVLRVLDFSRASRHLLVTAGDDGTVHLWDTTGHNPKISWRKLHLAPVSGVNFSPLNDKVIACVGLDKKLYTCDSGSKKPASCVSYEAPFASLAYKGDGSLLAAGTINGRVVFYDVRAQLQPLVVLRAYNSSEAVASLSWQRLKPVIVNENCSLETALLGNVLGDPILMPDPLPSVTSNAFISTAEETPLQSRLWPDGSLTRLQAPHPSYSFKDDMDVFSPVVDVKPITPLERLWEENEASRKADLIVEKKDPTYPSAMSNKKIQSTDEVTDNSSFNWRSSSASKQVSFASTMSAKVEEKITPPEEWGGEKLSDKLASLRQSLNLPFRLGTLSSSPSFAITSAAEVPCVQTSTSLLSTPKFSDSLINPTDSTVSETSKRQPDLLGHGYLPSLDMKGSLVPPKHDMLDLPASSAIGNWSSASYAMSLGDITSHPTDSPKMSKAGSGIKGNVFNHSQSKMLSASEGGRLELQKDVKGDGWQGNFTLQLVERMLSERLDLVQKSMHEDLRNLHIELLRQFHLQETTFSTALKSITDSQAELIKEIKDLRRENQELRRLL